MTLSFNFRLWFGQVKCQDFILNFWKESLNPMTWPEILRQLLVAAGFGLRHGTSPKEALGKVFGIKNTILHASTYCC